MAEDDSEPIEYQPDPLRFLGFLPGANHAINLQKKIFYQRLVKRGLWYMYEKNYDFDPDSPILREDHTKEESVCRDVSAIMYR